MKTSVTMTRKMLQSVDDDEKQCVSIVYASSGQQEQSFLTENDIYEVTKLNLGSKQVECNMLI